ncbi:hypothetical protein X943_001399 [Babesia divergens]|uniref:Uncharacterized protein n=1 Tax=Babesia divergens TaxID=32595 RepID=A0AAD9LKQ7_BABDI|nr:hypothetical protein X943_001399 [Babesia divergens]
MGKKNKRANKQQREACVRKLEVKGTTVSNSPKERRRCDVLLRWLAFELALLQRIVYRVGYPDYMVSVCQSVRCLKKFTGLFKRVKSNAELASLYLDDTFNCLFYRSLKSVLETSARISRIHSHHFHVPLIAVLISIYRYASPYPRTHGTVLAIHYTVCNTYTYVC